MVALHEEEQYVTVRIPNFFNDLIKKYIELHQEEMKLLGQRTSRAGVVKKALYEFFMEEGIIQEKTKTEKGVTSEPDDFWIRVKETFFAHSILKISKEAKLPGHHSDLDKLEQLIKRYIIKRAEEKGKEVTEKYLIELTKELVDYHEEIVEGLNIIAAQPF